MLYRRLFSDRYHLITARRGAARHGAGRVGDRARLGSQRGRDRGVLGAAAGRVRVQAGSKHFIALLAREAGDATADAHSVVSAYLDPSVEVCLQALRAALPGVEDTLIVQGYLWMIAATMSTITAAGRAQRLAARAPMPRQPDALRAPLVAFITGGLLAITPMAALPS